MSFLRTVSTRRLVALCALVVAIGVAGAAIALGAGGGPVPPRKPLAAAVRDALRAKPVDGITARITFSNHLIDASSLQGSDPLLAGASGRLWLGAGDRLRLELQSDSGDAQIVSDGHTLSVYDASSNTAYKVKLPAARGKDATKKDAPPGLGTIRRILARLTGHLDVSGAVPTDIAGRPAYTVRLAPKHDGGLLGSAEVAWDAANGVPLRAAVYARGNDAPVLELKATKISYGAVSASTFDVTPPAGAKTTTVALPARHRGRQAEHARALRTARSLPFTLAAPKTLVGLPRQDVRPMRFKGHGAALVTYGRGLGGIAVIEQAATKNDAPAPAPSGRRGERPGLSLPTVSINGATGHELDTALGTFLTFTRGGVRYTVLGSVPPAAAEAAARAL